MAGALTGGTLTGGSGGGIVIEPSDVAGASSGQSCNTLDERLADAPWISEEVVAQAPPAPSGGKLQDGIYHLTAWQRFTGPGGSSEVFSYTTRSVLEVRSSSDVAAEVSQCWMELRDLAMPVEQNRALTLDGASYEDVVTCSDRDAGNSAGSGFYTATLDALLLHDEHSGSTSVRTYTRQ